MQADSCVTSSTGLVVCRCLFPFLLSTVAEKSPTSESQSHKPNLNNETRAPTQPNMKHHKPTLPLPLIALLALSLIFTTTTLAFASRTLSLFNSQQPLNPWLLPLWRGHFDLRGLKLVVGTSAAIVLLDTIAVIVVLLQSMGVSSFP